MNELSISEQGRLESLETIIEGGMQTFVDVGMALIEIRDGRLYRISHGTFEDYCRERWGMARNYANKLIAASALIENLGTNVPIPKTESVVRPLVTLEPIQQREAWKEATQRAEAESRPVNARDVKDAVYKLSPHVSHNSGENEWYTPSEYIEAARNVMGTIHLDPASSEIANRTVKALFYYDKQSDGLNNPWAGNVFMNPPYSSELIKQFTAKYSAHFKGGDIQEAIVLVNNATETVWFAELVGCSSAIVFTSGRVKFLDPQGNPGAPLQGQAILYSGKNPNKFLGEFLKFGWGARL